MISPFLYTLSGTQGYTYTAVGKGYPAIAFSGGNGAQRSYKTVVNQTAAGYADPATIQAQLAVKLINQLIDSVPKKERLLPLGFGMKYDHPRPLAPKDFCSGTNLFQREHSHNLKCD